MVRERNYRQGHEMNQACISPKRKDSRFVIGDFSLLRFILGQTDPKRLEPGPACVKSFQFLLRIGQFVTRIEHFSRSALIGGISRAFWNVRFTVARYESPLTTPYVTASEGSPLVEK